jgi:hypothetical protein
MYIGVIPFYVMTILYKGDAVVNHIVHLYATFYLYSAKSTEVCLLKKAVRLDNLGFATQPPHGEASQHR